MTNGTDNFINAMLESAKKKEETKPQKRIEADPDEVEGLLKEIQDKLQKK